MKKHPFSTSLGKAKVAFAFALSAGLLMVPTAIPASATSPSGVSASATAPLQAASTLGLEYTDPMALLTFDSNVGVVLRGPSIPATESEADLYNTPTSTPTLTCYEGVTSAAPDAIASTKTITGQGSYGSDESMLVLYFYMDEVPTSDVDLCTMTGTTYLHSEGTSQFAFNKDGAKAIYGDPAKLVAQAQAQLNTVKTAAANLYKKAGKFDRLNNLRTELRRALKTNSIIIRPIGEQALTAGTNVTHLIRSESNSSSLSAAVRLADARLVTMKYNGKTKKTSFTVSPKEFDNRITSTATTAKSSAQASVKTQGALKPPTSSYFKLGSTSPIYGLRVDYTGVDVFVALKASRGVLSIPAFAQTGLVLEYGYSKFEGSSFAFHGPAADVNRGLAALKLTVPNASYVATDRNLDVRVDVTAMKHRSDLAFNPQNLHFYKFVSYPSGTANADKTGDKSTAAAEASKELGVSGYLATITDADENSFVAEKIRDAKNIWINGSDSETEGVWKYTSGPEKGQTFWNGCGAKATPAGSAPAGMFTKWNEPDKEPNNYIANGDTCEQAGVTGKQATAGEDCAVTNWSRPWIALEYRTGYWNDLACDSPADSEHVGGYLIEYGEKIVTAFEGVETSSSVLKARPASVKAVAPNFFQKVFSLLGMSKKVTFLPKKPKKPATFTFTAKVRIQTPGTYNVVIKRPNGKGAPFQFQPETSVTRSVRTTYTTAVWKLVIITRKDNEVVTIKPVLKTNNPLKPKDTKLFFELRPRPVTINQICWVGGCQSASIPVPNK